MAVRLVDDRKSTFPTTIEGAPVNSKPASASFVRQRDGRGGGRAFGSRRFVLRLFVWRGCRFHISAQNETKRGHAGPSAVLWGPRCRSFFIFFFFFFPYCGVKQKVQRPISICSRCFPHETTWHPQEGPRPWMGGLGVAACRLIRSVSLAVLNRSRIQDRKEWKLGLCSCIYKSSRSWSTIFCLAYLLASLHTSSNIIILISILLLP